MHPLAKILPHWSQLNLFSWTAVICSFNPIFCFKCEYCAKSFTQADSLKRNIGNIHEVHKDLKCDSCGLLFTYAGNMRRHIKIVHEGDKDFKCESCEK